MSGWADEYLELIDDCEAREDRLSDWERVFIDSIQSQLLAGNSLSAKQVERLDEIWEKATSKG